MELSKDQINTISNFILNCDIKAYVASHQKEYNEFLEQEKNKS